MTLPSWHLSRLAIQMNKVVLYMKKFLSIAVAAICLFTMVIFVSCGKEADSEDVAALSNEIFEGLEADFNTAVSILTYQMCKPVDYSDGVDKNGNLLVLDGDWYIPLVEEYDTADEINAVLKRVYTEQKCAALSSELFGEGGTFKEIDGALYCEAGDIVYQPFNLPFESASRLSDTEILAKTSVTYDSGDVSFEIVFKNENGDWRIDKLTEDGRDVDY